MPVGQKVKNMQQEQTFSPKLREIFSLAQTILRHPAKPKP